MDDLKIPIILLLCIICGTGLYLYNKSQNPVPPKKVTPKTEVIKTISEEEKKEQKVTEEKAVLKKANDAFEQDDYSKTLVLLSNYKDSKNYDIQKLIAYSLSSQKEYDRAIIAFEKVLKIRKVPADGYSLGYLYELTGRFEAAKSLYLELAELKLPTNLEKKVYEGIARISTYLPFNNLFVKYTDKLFDNWPDSKDGVVALIKLKKQSKAFNDINRFAEKADKYFSKDYNYNYEMAELFEAADNYKDSVNYYKKCIKLDSNNYTPFLDCYRVLLKSDKTDAAIKALEYYLDSEQVFPTIYYDTALLALKNKRYKQAFRFYLYSVVSDSRILGKEDNGLVSKVESYFREKGTETEKVFVNAFVCYLNGDYSYAISEINRIQNDLDNSVYKNDSKLVLKACKKLANIDQERENAQKAYEMAYNNYLKAKEDEKKRELEEAKKKAQAQNTKQIHDEELKIKALKNINNYDIQMEVGREFLGFGKVNEAKTYFNNASKLKKDSHEPYVELTKVSLFQKDSVTALKYIEEAVKRNSSEPKTLSLAASVNFNNNNIDKAKEYAESALRIDSNNTPSKMILARIYIMQQNYRAADELIDNALTTEKNNVMRNELLKLKKEIKK